MYVMQLTLLAVNSLIANGNKVVGKIYKIISFNLRLLAGIVMHDRCMQTQPVLIRQCYAGQLSTTTRNTNQSNLRKSH